MAKSKEMAVRQKQELASQERGGATAEQTVPARYYIPPADIYETGEALTVVLEMPGVEKKDLAVTLENGVLRVEGRIDFSKYEGLEPVYTEYNVGHYARSFTLGSAIDQAKIDARLEDGVLTLTLPKAEAAKPRRVAIA